MSLSSQGIALSIVGAGEDRRLRATAAEPALLASFEGSAAAAPGDGVTLDGPLSARNGAAVRACLPRLRPRPIGLRTSAGVGDRLGLATPGHVEAFRAYAHGVEPVFAQQSAREIDRLGRTPADVLNAATFGCVEGSWEGTVGADADHLKSVDDVDRFLEAGFTTFTIDPGDSVNDVSAGLAGLADGRIPEVPWSALEDDQRSMERRYAALDLEVDRRRLAISPEALHLAAAKYGAAIVKATELYRHLMSTAATSEVEVEIAVDETAEPTTLVEHAYLATEMRRLGLRWVSLAPRYLGGFEKGVEYIGSPTEFERDMESHAALARALGPYKLSLHSGSDKFSIYEAAAAATSGLIHLKTSGTSYLVALHVAALYSPELFLRIYSASRDAYLSSRASYHVSASLEGTSAPQDLPVDRLTEVVRAPESRQILHVGYAAALADPGTRQDLVRLLGAHASDYRDELKQHLGRHLRPFASEQA